MVSVSEENVLVSGSRDKGIVSDFTLDEWRAFIKGVKDGEFDV